MEKIIFPLWLGPYHVEKFKYKKISATVLDVMVRAVPVNNLKIK